MLQHFVQQPTNKHFFARLCNEFSKNVVWIFFLFFFLIGTVETVENVFSPNKNEMTFVVCLFSVFTTPTNLTLKSSQLLAVNQK